MTTSLERAGTHLLHCCSQPRYRTAWLIGPPLSGKTTLARQLCDGYSWRYINYALQPGFFDAVQNHVETYQPNDLVHDIRRWCAAEPRAIIVIDELDAALALWSIDQRRWFAAQASRIAHLPHGLIIVSNLFDTNTLAPLVPTSDIPSYFNLPGVPR